MTECVHCGNEPVFCVGSDRDTVGVPVCRECVIVFADILAGYEREKND